MNYLNNNDPLAQMKMLQQSAQMQQGVHDQTAQKAPMPAPPGGGQDESGLQKIMKLVKMLGGVF